jgi:penicillin amidase
MKRNRVLRRLFQIVLGRRLPPHSGRLRVTGIGDTVVIRRDGHGVPVIEAQTDDDAWFGLGFCQGQDRAGQLEVVARIVRGTLAEVAGEDGLAMDRLARRVGWRRAAESQVASADPDIRRQLEAYAAGINAGIEVGGGRLAHELALLRATPSRWEPADAQAVVVLLCFALASNWDIELLRLKILQSDGPEALRALDPSYPEWLPVSAPPRGLAGQTVDQLAADLDAFTALMGAGGGSNAWAVAGARTASGRPIVANDPHLNPAVPAQWYLAHLRTPEWAAAGAAFVGIPAIAVGHNGFAAWGGTAAHADNTDLFLEEIGRDGRSVREGRTFAPCRVLREEIRVRGRKEPVVEEVLITPRGPIIGPALGGGPDAVSLSATWLSDRPYTGFLGMHKVAGVDDFRQVFAAGSASTASVVYADVTGKVAWQLAVQLPKRRRGNGTVPLPAWENGVGWEADSVPHDEMPFLVDPEAGFVATANNQPTPVDPDGPFLGVDWLDGFRQAAIGEALEGRDDWDVARTLALQLDTRSLPWRAIRDVVLALEPETRAASQALALLGDWDGRVSSHSVGASVFELFVAEMCQRLVRAKAPKAARWALGRGYTELLPYNLILTRRLSHLVDLVQKRPDGFFVDGWEAEMLDALAAVVVRLSDRFGSDSKRWRWGQVRPLRAIHPFGEKPPLDALFNLGPFPGRGDAATISQGLVDLRDPTANPVGVPTLRAVLDTSDWDASRFSMLGGQSGNPFSPHYDDLIPFWLRGEGVPIPWSEPQIRATTEKTLRLVAADGA